MNVAEAQTSTGQGFGIQGFQNASAPALRNPNAVSPHAMRWLFNPFAHIDIASRPVSGHLQLFAGKFIPITSQNDRVSISGIRHDGTVVGAGSAVAPLTAYDAAGNATGIATPVSNGGTDMRDETRSAFAIASELESAYAEKGVMVLESLTKFNDFEAVQMIFDQFIQPGLEYNDDPSQPDFPVPNLTKLEHYLVNTAAMNAKQIDGDLDLSPTAVISDVLTSVRAGLAQCRSVTENALNVVANKTVGYQHSFDAYAKRCFIALGKAVPSDLGELYGKNALPANAPAADNSEVIRLRAENDALKAEKYESEIERLRAENAALKANSTDGASAPAESPKCGATKADGNICQAAPVTGNEHCRHHLTVESDITEETSNHGNERTD